MTREEWDQLFFTIMPVASLGIGAISIALGAIVALRERAAAQRVSYADTRYLIDVRYGELHDPRDFVTPYDPSVQAIYCQVGPDAWALYDWVCRDYNYLPDTGEWWRYPRETIKARGGDCEDTSILLCSLLKNFNDGYVVLGGYRGYGHAWVELHGEILETTYTFARPVPDPQDYQAFAMFDNQDLIELWPGAMAEIFAIERSEPVKLDLMARALEKVA
ncbi:hypothetical protein ES703_42412 [subsurface metagenome]